MKLLRFQPGAPGAEANTIGHGTETWVTSNSSWIVEVPDHVADFMLADGRSGAVMVEDPPPVKGMKGGGAIVRCPCCHHAWREG
jgi:hypothetical protein